MRRLLAAVIAIALLGLGGPAYAEEEHTLMALPADVMQFLGIYAAQDLGFWKAQGLDVKTQLITGKGIAEGARFIDEKPAEALALLKKHFDKIDPAVVERAFQGVVTGTPVPPIMTAAVLSNSEHLNIEAGLEVASIRLSSYDRLYTDEFVK